LSNLCSCFEPPPSRNSAGNLYTHRMDAAHESLVEERVFERAQRLLAVQHAVAEMTGGRKVETDPLALKNAILQIRTAVQSIPGAYCVFIGGLAVQEHGYVRWTDDVDVVVDAEHYREVLRILQGNEIATLDASHHRFNLSRIPVDLFKDGGKAKKKLGVLPPVHTLGLNCSFADMNALISLKISSATFQDQADVVEVLKRNISKTEHIKNTLPKSLREEFGKLVVHARRELN
jgi:hypothetical protein